MITGGELSSTLLASISRYMTLMKGGVNEAIEFITPDTILEQLPVRAQIRRISLLGGLAILGSHVLIVTTLNRFTGAYFSYLAMTAIWLFLAVPLSIVAFSAIIVPRE